MCRVFLLLLAHLLHSISCSVLNLAWPQPCGVSLQRERNMRIVGGKPAFKGQFPWAVSLRKRTDTNSDEFSHFCAGTLVTNRHVVTAAHCVHDRPATQWQVVAGEWKPAKSEEGEQIRQVESITRHPRYLWPYYRYDIALLTLTETINWSHEVSPVCIPADEATFENHNATLVGWGFDEQMDHRRNIFSEVLMYTTVPVLSNNQCQSWFDEQNYKQIKINDCHLCAGFAEGGHDGCQGDSGGPLTVSEEGESTLIGIVSIGIGCGRPKLPGIYTRVSQFSSWIQNATSHSLEKIDQV